MKRESPGFSRGECQQYVRDPGYFMIPLFCDRNASRPNMYRSVGVYLSVGEFHWGQIGSRELMEDEHYYREVGEIDLDSLILDAIKRAIGYEQTVNNCAPPLTNNV